jgi:type I restriction enzyme M protein
VLFGSGKAFVAARKLMVEQSELKAVITLPSGVFKPYAGVACAILIFTKGGETRDVWFYDMQSDGYSLDDKRTKLDKSDLQDIIKQYHSRSVTLSGVEGRTGKHFFVPKTEIVTNDYDLSLSKYKQEVYEEVIYEKPEVIFKKLQDLETSISKGLKELNELMR